MSRLAAAALASCSLIGCGVADSGPDFPGSDTLPLRSANSGVLVGSYLVDAQRQPTYARIAQTEFSAGQSLYYAGFGGWPGPHDYGYDGPLASINWMDDRRISSHVHMLIGYDHYMPGWLTGGTWTSSELDSLMKAFIYAIIDTNGNATKVDVWNVANELFNDDGTYRTNTIWNQLGWEGDRSGLTGSERVNASHPVFIGKAFRYCRDRTDAKLEYRDFHIETNSSTHPLNRKHRAVFQMLRHLLNSGVPVDAVGIQGHYDIGGLGWVLDVHGLGDAVRHFRELGLEVYITELDIGSPDGSWSEVIARRQRDDYYHLVRQAVAAGVVRIYTWGIQDRADGSWRSGEHPLLWDENFRKKPAYYGVQQALLDTR